MGSEEVSKLRERATFMRRLAVMWNGDADISRELLVLAESLENEARALETAEKTGRSPGESEDARSQLSKRGRALLMGKVMLAVSSKRATDD
jgi:hypothetical protein